jgi:hypothetical protein
MNTKEFTYKQFIDWQYNNSWYPTNQEDLNELIEEFNTLDLEVCDCCGELVEYQHTFTARYDDVTICEGCRDDGN